MMAQARSQPLSAYGMRSLRQTYQEHWYQTQRSFNTTQLVQDLCLTLHLLRIPYHKGISASTGLLLIDVALTDRQVAIEALGPLKVLRNNPMVTGRAAHRQRLLSALGWTVVSVEDTECLKLKNASEKQHFLQQVLA
ncbi:hypothetical protein WJX82_000827 [Trebouxia sp. C0006]